MKLYGYFRSSCSYRVRIALNFKGIAYQQVPVNLLKNEQRLPSNLDRNPQGLVPSLEHRGKTMTQSLAIVEYLEDVFPYPPRFHRNHHKERKLDQLVKLLLAILSQRKIFV